MFDSPRASDQESDPPEWLRAKIVVLNGPEQGQEHYLERGRTVLGRGDDADVVLSDPALSRHHAEIRFSGIEYRVKDLGSSNGTLLNGSEVDEYAVRSGDKLTIGETILRFEIDRDESPG